MTEQRTTDGVQVRDRIDKYLHESGLAARNSRVVPLTGDASDRKYFRIIPAEGPSIVIALHTDAIDFAALPFANVGGCCAGSRCRCPTFLATRIRSASLPCRISAM